MIANQLRDMQDFRWCQNPMCGSGQVHNKNSREKNGRTTCYKCGESGCFKCSSLWHEGKRCDKAREEEILKLKPDERTRVVIDTTTNACPKCHAKIQRAGGCKHMRCK